MNKFRSLAHYEAAVGTAYRLLPFRFTPLDNERYVVSNDVGEFLVLSTNVLHAFIRRDGSLCRNDYNNLKSKHFLIDADSSVAIDLLALKMRTKHRRLADFTSLHIFVVSLRCEHSCPYCQVSRQSDDKASFDMGQATALKALDLVFSSPSPAIKIELQGGESLLNFDLIKFIVESAESRNATENRDLAFVIATNLAVVTEEILEFCRKHKILISTSLDGPRDLHNRNRPRPGSNSYELTIDGIKKARSVLGKDQVSALMTTTAASLPRVREIIDEYVYREFDGIFLRPLSPYGFAIKTKS